MHAIKRNSEYDMGRIAVTASYVTSIISSYAFVTYRIHGLHCSAKRSPMVRGLNVPGSSQPLLLRINRISTMTRARLRYSSSVIAFPKN
ncbi:hypothetical protein KC321_g53 [Hortaea werneckii]|nr:hypothetical protein KC321_g53 [Hortaea werneckii]